MSTFVRGTPDPTTAAGSTKIADKNSGDPDGKGCDEEYHYAAVLIECWVVTGHTLFDGYYARRNITRCIERPGEIG